MDKLLNKLYFIVIPILLVATIVMLGYTVSNNHRLAEQNEQLVIITDQLKSQGNATHKDVADVKSTLICIGSFFSLPNRTGVKIDTYSPCKITGSDGKTMALTSSISEPQNTPAIQLVQSQESSSSHTSPVLPSPNSTPPQQTSQPVISQPTPKPGPLATLGGVLRKLPIKLHIERTL